eukprot:2062969-Amphidinium_carterae.1
MWPSAVGSSSKEALWPTVAQTLGPMQVTALRKGRTTHGCQTASPFLMRSVGAAATRAWIWVWTSTRDLFPSPWCLAMSVTVLVDRTCHLDSAFVATTG